MTKRIRSGPLSSLRVLEFAGMGPGPFCGMLLSDLGADVLRIDRKGEASSPCDVTRRGRRSVVLDLKRPEAVKICLELFETADAVIEVYRPGVMERLGLGPDQALNRNAKLIYARMTGWGQSGPNAPLAGHDINYISLTGGLDAIGFRNKPIVPLNLLGDFGGGGLYLAFGILAAVTHARQTGEGQVVDCAMVDGASILLSAMYGMKASGAWNDHREDNMLDGGAPYYDTYQCADGEWVSLGSLESKFYRIFLNAAGINEPELYDQSRANWSRIRKRLTEIIAARKREEWLTMLEHTDACFTPILSAAEAPNHPHLKARGVFVEYGGVTQPAPGPRFSATPAQIQNPPPSIGAHTRTALADWGITEDTIRAATA